MDKRKGRKHSLEVRMRAFRIWQKLGLNPWAKAKEDKDGRKSGSFYKGAFDSIPFLNDDAKRTFVHLLLRPGYMIRDYIRGEHDKYLAPLTALIIFYAFFALLSSVLQPMQQDRRLQIYQSDADSLSLNISVAPNEASDSTAGKGSINADNLIQEVTKIVQKGYIYLHLDQYPEEVHTQSQASLAALESALRSQGIPLFIGNFILLWLAMTVTLKRYNQKASACAAASAYVLCQFSFFMLFALLLSWGKSTSISAGLMLLLLVIDYRQWLDITWPESIRRAIRTGLFYILLYFAVIVAVSLLVLLVALIRNSPQL